MMTMMKQTQALSKRTLKSGKKGKGIGVADATDTVSQLYWRPDDRALAALDAQGCITVWRT